MGASPPKPTPPRETSAATTASNVTTAIANAYLQNMDETTPYGTKSFTNKGSQSVYDPYTDKTHDIPTFAVSQTLTPAGQRLQDTNVSTQQNLADTGLNVSRNMYEHMSARPSFEAPSLRTGAGVPIEARDSIPRQTMATGFNGTAPDAGPVTRSYGTDFSQDRRRVEDAIMSRMRPDMDRDREALRTRLANQGITIGSDAYNAEMGRLDRGANDARMQAILAGGQEQSRMTGLEAQRAGFQNSAQGQAFQQGLAGAEFGNTALDRANAARAQQSQIDMADASLYNQAQGQRFNQGLADAQLYNQAAAQGLQSEYAARNQPINEVSALLNGAQVQQPQFLTGANIGAIPTTDNASIIGNYDNAEMARWKASQAATGSLLSGFGGLFAGGKTSALAGLMSLSDERTKTDKRKVGKTKGGLGIYTFRYKGDPRTQMGVMAQDVQKKKPGAVGTGPGGLMMVDYSKVR